MSNTYANEKEEYYQKSRDTKTYFYHVKNQPDKPWDYEYLFQKNIYPGLGIEKQLVEKWISFFPVDKLNFSALSQHHYISQKWFDLFPEAPWVLEKLSRNPKFKFSMFLNSSACQFRVWDWSNIIFSPGDVSLDKFRTLLNCCWNIKNYLHYPITVYWLDYIPDSPEIYLLLSQNKHLDISWLQSKPQAPWKVEMLWKHPSFQEDWVRIVKSSKWPFRKVSALRYLTLEILQTYPEETWDFSTISKNELLEPSWVQAFPDGDWDFTKIGRYTCLDFKWAELFPDAPWDFYKITLNIKDYPKWICKYPNADWDYTLVFMQPDLTLELLKIIPVDKLDFDILSTHAQLTTEWLEAFPKAPWNSKNLSRHSNFKIEWVDKFPEFDWCFNNESNPNKPTNSYKVPRLGVCNSDYKYGSRTASVTYIKKGIINIHGFYHSIFKLAWFEKYPDLDWDYHRLSKSFVPSLEFLQKYPDKPWDFAYLSINPNLSLDMLNAYPDANWDYDKIQLHQNFDIDWIPHIPPSKRDYSTLSSNENFCAEWFLRYPKENWDIERILYLDNTFKYLIIYQYYHPATVVLSSLHNQYINEILENPIPLFLLNPGNQKYLYLVYNLPSERQELMSQLGYWKDRELNEEEKKNVMKLCDMEYDFEEFYPDLIYNMDAPLELQDLSGTSFPVKNWFDSDDIISLIYETHPELQGSKFVICEEENSDDDDEEDNDFVANVESNEDFKDKLLENQDGPFAMVVYTEVEE